MYLLTVFAVHLYLSTYCCTVCVFEHINKRLLTYLLTYFGEYYCCLYKFFSSLFGTICKTDSISGYM